MAVNQKMIFVYDDFSTDQSVLIGCLYINVIKGGESYSFEYDKEWLKKTRLALTLDPELMPYAGRQYPNGKNIFGLFADASPDRWGRVLMNKRERILAEREGRKPSKLYDSDYLLEEGRAFIYIDKEVQRVDKAAIQELHGKDVILVFPEESRKNKTVRVLKLPKTESSIRKVFLPKSIAEMLVEWKKGQDKIKETLGEEYMDYNLVMATPFGLPVGTSSIRKALNDLIKEHNLPPVVFHSLRHTSVTYKLKLNGGDIKAVQGDSGHSQINMVTDVYSHIIDDDRRKNAELFEEAFYEKKDLDPSMHAHAAGKTVELPTDVDAELLAKVLSNPEMAALLSTLAKSLEKK